MVVPVTDLCSHLGIPIDNVCYYLIPVYAAEIPFAQMRLAEFVVTTLILCFVQRQH